MEKKKTVYHVSTDKQKGNTVKIKWLSTELILWRWLAILFISGFLIGCASPDVALQKKYNRKSTVELKMKRQQLLDAMGSGGMDFRFGSPIALAMMGNPREARIKEKDEIERELLRRYMAGDKVAYLPMFD